MTREQIIPVVVSAAATLAVWGGIIAFQGDEPLGGSGSSCETHHLCTYDGIEYSYLVDEKVPKEEYPTTALEFSALKSTLEAAKAVP